MAYQNVGGTPRFYIDALQYIRDLGFEMVIKIDQEVKKDLLDLVGLDPVIPKEIEGVLTLKWSDGFDENGNLINDDAPFPSWYLSSLINPEKAYYALLNHNITLDPYEASCELVNPSSPSWTFDNKEEVLNATDLGDIQDSYLNCQKGSTIAIGDISSWVNDPSHHKVRLNILSGSESLHLGALSVGSYYDMPVSPDLSLSMNIEFDGYDNTKTLNGSTLTNARYMGSPWWYDKDGNKREPWAIGDSTGVSKRNGRRTWNLKFSYMSDKNLFASNYGSSNYLQSDIGYSVNDLYFQDILSDNIADLNLWDVDSSWSVTSIVANSNYTSASFEKLSDIGGSIDEITTSINTDGTQYYYASLEVTNYDDHGSTSIANTSITLKDFNTEEGGLGQSWINSPLTLQGNGIVEANFLGTAQVEMSVGHHLDADIKIIIRNTSTQTELEGFQYNIGNDDSFSAQVLNKISHGQKFIFQPNNTASNPSDFAICVLDQDSFSMKRTAWNVYDISMKIKEVW